MKNLNKKKKPCKEKNIFTQNRLKKNHFKNVEVTY